MRLYHVAMETHVFQHITFEFHNCKMFPPQTISNIQYELHMPVVTLLGQGGKDKIYTTCLKIKQLIITNRK